jgi:hypothetical protein
MVDQRMDRPLPIGHECTDGARVGQVQRADVNLVVPGLLPQSLGDRLRGCGSPHREGDCSTGSGQAARGLSADPALAPPVTIMFRPDRSTSFRTSSAVVEKAKGVTMRDIRFAQGGEGSWCRVPSMAFGVRHAASDDRMYTIGEAGTRAHISRVRPRRPQAADAGRRFAKNA